MKASVSRVERQTTGTDDLRPSDVPAVPRPLSHGIAAAVPYASETSVRRPFGERARRRRRRSLRARRRTEPRPPRAAAECSSFEVLIGLDTGILVEQVNGLPAAERATGARLVEDFTGSSLIRTFELTGGFAWLIAVDAAGVALFRRADARSSVAVVLLLLVSAVPITWHVSPSGPVGLALFITAMLLVLRGRSSARASDSLVPRSTGAQIGAVG
jgi:hypothetical protein